MTEQLAFLTQDGSIARELAREGMERALDRANREHDGWGDAALAFLKRYAEQHQDFTAFMVTATSVLDKSFPQPPSTHAWGGIYRRAQREGVMVKKLGAKMPHPTRHGQDAQVYRSLVWRGGV